MTTIETATRESEKTVRVCHITTSHKNSDVRIFQKECKSLADYGYDVTLLSQDSSLKSDSTVSLVSSGKSYSSRIVKWAFGGYRQFRMAKRINADIYHFHDPNFLPFALLLKVFGRGKVIYDVHEDVEVQIRNKAYLPKHLRRGISKVVWRLEAYCVSRFSAIVTATDFIQNKMSLINDRCITVCNYPIWDEFVELGTLNKVEDTICYIGALSRIRGIKDIVESVEGTKIKLIVAGHFQSKRFQEEVTELKGWGNVDYRGYVDREEVANIIEESQIGMILSHPTNNYVDALPTKMFEYMAGGIAVLSSDFKLLKTIVSDYECGKYANPLDPVEIRTTLLSMLNDKNELKFMGDRGRTAVKEELNWGRESEKLRVLYQSLSGNE